MLLQKNIKNGEILMNNLKDMKVVQFPRLNNKITPLVCYDDCIASFSTFLGLEYEKAYSDALNTGFVWKGNSIGRSYINNTKIEENLKKYCGIEIINYKCCFDEAIDIIMSSFQTIKPICIELLGYYCPWDWRYQVLESGNHYFFLVDYDPIKNKFRCIDPYYQIEDEFISYDDVKNGYLSFQIFQYKEPSYKYDDLNEIRKSISTFLYCGHLDSLSELANRIRNNFDIAIEVIDYKNINNFNLDELKNNVILNDVFMNIILNRIRFSCLLKKLVIIYPQFAKEFLKLSDNYIIISQKWESVRLMLIKRLLTNQVKEVCDALSKKIELIASEEKELALKLISILDGKHTLTKEGNESILQKETGIIKFVNLEEYYNNEGVGVSSLTKADFNGVGEYFDSRFFPSGKIVNYNDWKFLIPVKVNGKNDNLSCRRNVIKVEPKVYGAICILGCSEWGSYTDEITIIFDDEAEESFTILLQDYIPNYLTSSEQKVAFQTQKSINNQENEFDTCNVYAVEYKIKTSKQIAAIRLPECATMHIFAISLK